MAVIKLPKIGYGQIEPNRLASQSSKSIFSQLPANKDMELIEQGMAAVYDQVKGEVRFPVAGDSDVSIVMNEVLLPLEGAQMDRDFALIAHPQTDHQAANAAYPRLFPLTVGDAITTNTIKVLKDFDSIADKAVFLPDVDGYWVETAEPKDAPVQLALVKKFTMPDGQKAVKLAVIRAGGK